MSAIDYQPIAMADFQRAYAAVLHAASGTLRLSSGVVIAPKGGNPAAEAVFVGGLLFADTAQRESFYWRLAKVLPLTQDGRYQKYRSAEGMTLHVALLRAVCAVKGSKQMTKRALRAALDLEFRHQLTLVASDIRAFRQ